MIVFALPQTPLRSLQRTPDRLTGFRGKRRGEIGKVGEGREKGLRKGESGKKGGRGGKWEGRVRGGMEGRKERAGKVEEGKRGIYTAQ